MQKNGVNGHQHRSFRKETGARRLSALEAHMDPTGPGRRVPRPDRGRTQGQHGLGRPRALHGRSHRTQLDQGQGESHTGRDPRTWT